MFMQPAGPELTTDQIRDLDDDFFGSRPFGYFSARIASLTQASESTDVDVTSGIGSRFADKLHLPHEPAILPFTESDRALQVATDSFALRHHAAEALVRLYHALTVDSGDASKPVSVWATIADGPNQTIDLVNQARADLRSVGVDNLQHLVLTSEAKSAGAERLGDGAIEKALNVMGSWLERAMDLLVGGEMNLNAAHNKVKHGLSVRSRDDVRVSFIPRGPDIGGTIPVSAFSGEGVIDVFDTPTLNFLARPPRSGGRKHGLELSALKLEPAQLLAETWMIAVAHAAMFHVAAVRHFDGRDGEVAPYPALPTGPTPQALLAGTIVGMRNPVTTPPDGGKPTRSAGLASYEGFTPLTIDYSSEVRATVVEG